MSCPYCDGKKCTGACKKDKEEEKEEEKEVSGFTIPASTSSIRPILSFSCR